MRGTISMEFTKPALSVEEQLELLIQRGLHVPDKSRAFHYLRYIGYYRFSGYTHPLQSKTGEDHEFKPGVEFEDALKLYIFDRKLRLHVLDAIERIEVAIRAQYSLIMSSKYGAHWYLAPSSFKDGFDHSEFIRLIEDQIGNDSDRPGRRDVFIDHYFKKYTHPKLPQAGWYLKFYR